MHAAKSSATERESEGEKEEEEKEEEMEGKKRGNWEKNDCTAGWPAGCCMESSENEIRDKQRRNSTVD
jgi:hypothetical protein